MVHGKTNATATPIIKPVDSYIYGDLRKFMARARYTNRSEKETIHRLRRDTDKNECNRVQHIRVRARGATAVAVRRGKRDPGKRGKSLNRAGHGGSIMRYAYFLPG